MMCSEPCELLLAIMRSELDKVHQLYSSRRIITNDILYYNCPMGLTPKQLTLCLLIFKRQGVITSYTEFAQLHWRLLNIKTTSTAIRERIKSLKRMGIFSECVPKRRGSNQGMSLILQNPINIFWSSLTSENLNNVACIPQSPASSPPASPTHSLPYSQPLPIPQTSLLLNKKEEEFSLDTLRDKYAEQKGKEKFIRLTPNEFANRWPNLTKEGFDYQTFRGVLQEISDLRTFYETWEDSLKFAEFDSYHRETLTDRQGKRIVNFRDWIWVCFKKGSYYPRPKNYLTPSEQKQITINQSKLADDDKKLMDAFDRWREDNKGKDKRLLCGLSLSAPFPLEETMLKYFKLNVYPYFSGVQEKDTA